MAAAINAAAALAVQHKAEVAGLFTSSPPPPLENFDERRGDKAKATFKEIMETKRLRWRWHHEHGDAARQVSHYARYADMVMVGQPARPSDMASHPAENAVIACGRPVIVLPYAGRFETMGDNILLAWNGARRPLGPFMMRCRY